MATSNRTDERFSDLDDRKRWLAFQRGDRAAFEQLYEQHVDSMAAYGRRLTADDHLLEDAIQDVFVDLWRRKEHLAEVEHVKFYLLRALRNQFIRNSRQDVFERAEDIDDFLDLLVSLSSEQFTIDLEVATDQTARVRSAVERLAIRQKEAIHLRFYQGLGLDEMARIMDMNKQSVSNLLHKAYAALRAGIKLAVVLMPGFIALFKELKA